MDFGILEPEPLLGPDVGRPQLERLALGLLGRGVVPRHQVRVPQQQPVRHVAPAPLHELLGLSDRLGSAILVDQRLREHFGREQIAGLTLVSLLQSAAARGDLLRMRFPDEETVWRRLLEDGTSPQRQARLASHYSALQALLTRAPELRYSTVSAAACRIRDSKV